MFIDAHKKFMAALVAGKVDFLLVGGYAVIFYGYVHNTVDLDLWLKPENSNRDKLLPVFREFGISDHGIESLQQMDFTQPQAFHIGEQPYRIDFLTWMMGLKFEDAYANRSKLQVDSTTIPVIGLNDLLINKMLSERFKDKADVEELQKIHELRENED